MRARGALGVFVAGLIGLGACGDGGDAADTRDTHDGDAEVAEPDGDTTAPETDVPVTDTETQDSEVTGDAWAYLVARYDKLETLAGRGQQRDQGVEWVAAYEGGPATAAELSRPHMAMADASGRVFIADKEAHAIRRVDLDGTIHTVAGTGVPGDDGDDAAAGSGRRLNNPNGLFVLTRGASSGVVFILDTDNGKVRRLGVDGQLTTHVIVPGGVGGGRGLWVSDDEGEAWIGAGKRVLHWRRGVGVSVLADGFDDLGNLALDLEGRLVVTDRGANFVYRVVGGQKVVIAGNGETAGGGEGSLATQMAFYEPRAVWFLPDGGFFVGTHEGNQVWYVDPQGVSHLFLDGGDGHAHSGDGQYFRTPGKKVSEVRAVTVAPNGDVLVTENDFGYVRVVRHR